MLLKSILYCFNFFTFCRLLHIFCKHRRIFYNIPYRVFCTRWHNLHNILRIIHKVHRQILNLSHIILHKGHKCRHNHDTILHILNGLLLLDNHQHIFHIQPYRLNTLQHLLEHFSFYEFINCRLISAHNSTIYLCLECYRIIRLSCVTYIFILFIFFCFIF